MEHDVDRNERARRRAREVFDASVESLDDEVRSRLGRARFAAVASAERRANRSAWRGWVPAAVVASAAIVAVLLWRSPEQLSTATFANGSGDTAIEAVELLADGDDLALLENDLEFYEWLDATGIDAPGSSG
jgi:hypothetical protein